MTKKNDEVCGFLPKIDAHSPQGTLERLKLSDLKPTQNAVGMDEGNAKVANIKEKRNSAAGNGCMGQPDQRSFTP